MFSLTAGQTSPRRGQPRLAGLTTGVAATLCLSFLTGRWRAGMAVPLRLRCSLMSTSCTRSARQLVANSSKAREKMASLVSGCASRSRRYGAVSGQCSVARSALWWCQGRAPIWRQRHWPAQAHSTGGRPTPHPDSLVNSSMRTHSRVWMSFSSFGVSMSPCSHMPGISSR